MNKFTEDDKSKLVEALNFIANEAKFGDGPVRVDYSIKVRNHFAFLQTLIKKIDDSILEVKGVHEPETTESDNVPKKRRSRSTTK